MPKLTWITKCVIRFSFKQCSMSLTDTLSPSGLTAAVCAAANTCYLYIPDTSRTCSTADYQLKMPNRLLSLGYLVYQVLSVQHTHINTTNVAWIYRLEKPTIANNGQCAVLPNQLYIKSSVLNSSVSDWILSWQIYCNWLIQLVSAGCGCVLYPVTVSDCETQVLSLTFHYISTTAPV